MTWDLQKRAIWETRTFGNVTVQHVIGWMGRRHCGCYYCMGLRLDNHEHTFGAGACDEHGAQVKRAMDAYQNMPPSDREAGALWMELLEHELEASGVRV